MSIAKVMTTGTRREQLEMLRETIISKVESGIAPRESASLMARLVSVLKDLDALDDRPEETPAERIARQRRERRSAYYA